MANTADLVVRVRTESSGAGKGLDQAAGKMSKFGGAMKKAALPAAAVAAGVAKLGVEVVQSASRTQQAMGGVDAVFEGNAATVKKWADGAASSVGLAKSEYAELATVIGAQLKNAGLPMKDVTKQTGELIAKGADLAAMYGGTTKDAVEALSSAMKGESDPLEKYGASVTATKVAAEMAAQGTDKLTGKAKDQAKAMATLAVINAQTKDAVGAAAREQDTLASKTQQASAHLENMKSDIGTALLPTVAAMAGKLATMAEWMVKNKTVVMVLVSVLGGLAAGVLAVNVAMKVAAAGQVVYNAAMAIGSKLALGTRIQLVAMAVAQKAIAVATKISAAAQWLLNAAMSANPIGLVVIAVVALVAAMVVLYKKSETVRKIIDAMWSAIKAGATAAAAIAVAAFQAIGAGAKRVFSWIKSNWRLIAAILFGPVGIAVGIISKHWGKIRAGATAVLAWLKSAWKTAFGAIQRTAATALSAVKSAIDKIKSAADKVKSALGLVKTALGKLKVPSAVKTALDAVKTAAGNVKTAVSQAADWLGKLKVPSAVKTALDAIDGVLDDIGDAVDAVVRALSGIKVPKLTWPKPPSWVPGVNMAPAPAAAPRPAARNLAGTGTAAAGGGITINVTGALDPEAVARQIQRVLAGHGRRIGAAP